MKNYQLGVLLFDQFELLDAFGPLEMFGMYPENFRISLVGEQGGTAQSTQGPRSVLDYGFDTSPQFDILLVPGGQGTRTEASNPRLLQWLSMQSLNAEWTTSVCTGSVLLASAGLLEHRKATSNKNAFSWVTTFGSQVNWVSDARWVVDGSFYTSSGVSAGIDMSLALIAEIMGNNSAIQAANWAEYSWNNDAHNDPFAINK